MIYFDNSATTKISPEVLEAIKVSANNFSNPSSLYAPAVIKKREIESVATKIKKKLSVQSGDVIFTSGGTEANNLILHSAIKKIRGGEIIIGSLEHSSLIEPANYYKSEGLDVKITHPSEIIDNVSEKTRFISLMAVNNETGELFDINEVARRAKEINKDLFFHSDIVAAFTKCKLDMKNIDAVTITGHKIHAPKGVGALYIKNKSYITPLVFGGSQNSGLRGGTEPTLLIDALGVAVDNASPFDCKELKEALLDNIREDSRVVINSPENSADNIANISIKGVPSEVMLHALEAEGIYVSSGSACKGGAKSHVLKAMGLPADIINGALRISFSKYNNIDEVIKFGEILKRLITRFVKK